LHNFTADMGIDEFVRWIDFGLLILIWITQLVVYPSFLYYSRANLRIWHEQYVKKIGYIVAPLMLAQLVLGIYVLFERFDWWTLGRFLLIGATWILTFSQFVPLHASITGDSFSSDTLRSLVMKNWIRTTLWTAIFLLGLGNR